MDAKSSQKAETAFPSQHKAGMLFSNNELCMKIVWYRLTFFWGILLISFQGMAQMPVSHLPKIGVEQLKEDFQLLQKILEANHPS